MLFISCTIYIYINNHDHDKADRSGHPITMASTYATATALLLATAASDFKPIVVKPTDDDIFNITKVLYPLLHNLKYDEFLVVGVENHNLVGLLQLLAIYTAARGAPFARPANPGPYDLTILDAATPVVRNRMEAAHMVLVNYFNTFKAAKDGIKLFIMANIDETWIKPLRDPTSYYNNVTAYTMLEFLRTNSGSLHDVDLATLPSDMLHYYATAEGIPQLKYSREKLERGGVSMLDATLLATAHLQVMGSLHYPEATRKWERLAPAAKTWVAWQAHFHTANIERDCLLKMNPLAFGAANHVADTGIDSAAITMALDNIANAATNDASLIATLMERIKALELKARQPPIIDTGATRNITNTTNTGAIPFVPRVYTLAEALAIFDPTGYCHTHGWRVHKSHTSAKFKKKQRGHKNEATRADTMGGSNKNQVWETNPNPM